MKKSDTTILIETAHKIESIRRNADEQIAEEYRSLIDLTANKWGTSSSEDSDYQDTAKKVQEIRKSSDKALRGEYRSLVQAFQEIHGVDAQEAQYLIFQADLRLTSEDLD